LGWEAPPADTEAAPPGEGAEKAPADAEAAPPGECAETVLPADTEAAPPGEGEAAVRLISASGLERLAAAAPTVLVRAPLALGSSAEAVGELLRAYDTTGIVALDAAVVDGTGADDQMNAGGWHELLDEIGRCLPGLVALHAPKHAPPNATAIDALKHALVAAGATRADSGASVSDGSPAEKRAAGDTPPAEVSGVLTQPLHDDTPIVVHAGVLLRYASRAPLARIRIPYSSLCSV